MRDYSERLIRWADEADKLNPQEFTDEVVNELNAILFDIWEHGVIKSQVFGLAVKQSRRSQQYYRAIEPNDPACNHEYSTLAEFLIGTWDVAEFDIDLAEQGLTDEKMFSNLARKTALLIRRNATGGQKTTQKPLLTTEERIVVDYCEDAIRTNAEIATELELEKKPHSEKHVQKMVKKLISEDWLHRPNGKNTKGVTKK